MRCSAHEATNCTHEKCRREHDRRTTSVDSTAGGLSDPTSAVHQAVYGGSFYGSSGDTASSSGSCDTSSSSSSDSGSSSCGSSD